MQPVPTGPSSIENDAHGIEKFLLNTRVSLTSFLQSEVNQIIHIIVEDQEGQNNNIKYFLKNVNIIANSTRIEYFISQSRVTGNMSNYLTVCAKAFLETENSEKFYLEAYFLRFEVL